MKPILFNAEMVRAILDGRKTVTRRVVNHKHLRGLENLTAEKIQRACIAPVSIGDILYVREAYSPKYFDKEIANYWNGGNRIAYKADWDALPQDAKDLCAKPIWRPSIHMPREAARIFLRVTDVRVERLQNIDADGIRSEGLTSACVHAGDMEIATQEFALLWDGTIKPVDRERYGWAANPWVWVIAFERCAKPKEAIDGSV